MVSLNLKPKRQQWTLPSRLLVIPFIITVLLSSLSLFYDVTYSQCNSYFINTDFATHLPPPSLLISSPAVVSTSLASKQSYGLFNDIPDQRWELMRKGAHKVHTDDQKERSSMPNIQNDPIIEYLSSQEPDFNCPHENRVGGLGVGGPMWTCNAHRLLDRKECLIYSFGSDGKYTWEDGLIDLLGSMHCEIHVFDPGDHERAGDEVLKNIHYHKWDLKSSYHDMFNANLNRNTHRGVSLDSFTFQEILNKLGHQDRTIDILRVDCGQRTEWATYNDWLKADTRQIVVSTHGPPFHAETEALYLPLLASNFFAAFTSRYFAMFSKETTADGFDFGYVKLHPDFWTSGGQDFSTLRQLPLPQFSGPAPDADAAFGIPRQLVFAHEKNVMLLEDPAEVFFNVWNTVETYKKVWEVSEVDMWFVDSLTCLALLYTEQVELLPYYVGETNPARKTAICSVAAMYRSGGFFFDVDLEVGAPYAPIDDVSLVVARDGDSLSSQFMACEPRSSVMEMTLEKMLFSYKRNQTHPDFELGSSLEESIATLKATVRHEIVPLKVIGGESMPWIPPTLSIPADSFRNPVPLEMRQPPLHDFNIPRRLLFTYKSNLLETKDPPIFYENVQKTIKMYREAWGDPDAPVWFLDDDDCRSTIYAAKPNLVTYFDREPKGSWKADICRVAALYLTGGYYFDVDMEAVNPWIPSRNVTFATAVNPEKIRYFQSFMASEKGGRVIEEALDEMLLFYVNQKLRTKALIGPDTLMWAFESVAPSERGETVILEEISFSLGDAETPSQRREAVGENCPFKVQEPVSNVTIFYSRIVGAGVGCMDPNSPEGKSWVKAQAKNETM